MDAVLVMLSNKSYEIDGMSERCPLVEERMGTERGE